jgi:hypothetical protein
LEIRGSLKLGAAATAAAGTLQWDGTNFQGHNGTAWLNLGAGGGGAGGALPTKPITGSTTLDATAQVWLCTNTGMAVVTLPSVTSANAGLIHYIVKTAGGGAVNLVGSGMSWPASPLPLTAVGHYVVMLAVGDPMAAWLPIVIKNA